MPHRFIVADVFTDTMFRGNQLAVFPDAQGLSDRAMQAIAREFNFAETTFVLPPQDPRHARRVRIFTPKLELPFAGHPTIGTAATLACLGLVGDPAETAAIVLEEGAGPVAVEIRRDGAAKAFSRLALHRGIEQPSASPDRAAAAACLSLPPDAVVEAWFASVGVPFCFVHLASKKEVDCASLDRSVWSAGFAHAWASSLFVFAGDLAPESRLYARMFAPELGIEEDPATGSAAAALSGYLSDRLSTPEGIFTWHLEQGVAMGRPSLVEARAEKRGGRTVKVEVGGHTVLVGDGVMNVPAGF